MGEFDGGFWQECYLSVLLGTCEGMLGVFTGTVCRRVYQDGLLGRFARNLGCPGVICWGVCRESWVPGWFAGGFARNLGCRDGLMGRFAGNLGCRDGLPGVFVDYQ